MLSNFFIRRKILKKTNSLDLTPVRLMEYEIMENGRVDILLPRFKNIYFKRALQPKRKQEYIRIHLDEIGSAIWIEIDGKRNVQELCSAVQASHQEKLNPPDEIEERISKFISRLYQECYITFSEFSDKK